ncbi:DNRLRE domain-containing protein [Streptomyces sp. NPDC012888]|uniref:DNRLRE domain-containing protein n=1 Tax=Streptomyces sp. NPDC012888 TaxID=3364855 RepID=UPI00369B773C
MVQWPGTLPAPVVDGPRALYENVRPGIDLLLTARDSGYGHVLIVHDKQAAADPLLAELDYLLSSPDLTFRMNAETKVVSALDGQGVEMAVSPTPFMWDSAGEARHTVDEAPAVPEAAKDHPALGLAALAGPLTGGHAAPVDAELAADNTLRMKPGGRILNDPDTVYPVFVDPSFTGRKTSWATLYARYPDSSFYNGQNFNDGTNDARVGYESDTNGLSRAAFNFEFSSKLHNAAVKSAYLRTLQTYSYSCSARQYEVWQTGWVSSSSTWRNTNNSTFWAKYVNKESNGHGYRSGTCPDKWVGINIWSAVDDAAKNRWNALSLGLRASNESDTYS